MTSLSIPPVSTGTVRAPEASEGPGPDKLRDGDADDAAAPRAPSSAPAPAGMGKIVDKTV